MKKILATVLALILTLAVMQAVGEEKDKIVATWYVLMDMDKMSSPIENYTHLFVMFIFEENGDIWTLEADFRTDGVDMIDPELVGSWTHDETGYYTTLNGYASGKAYLNGSTLYLMLRPDTYYLMHRMTPMDEKYDVVNETQLILRGF